MRLSSHSISGDPALRRIVGNSWPRRSPAKGPEVLFHASGPSQAPALVAASSPPDPRSRSRRPLPPSRKPKPQVPQALQVDPVADLIARVEKEYQSGQDNYQCWAPRSRQAEFRLRLQPASGQRNRSQVRRPPRSAELDRILDGINGLELAALQQGDGFAEQKSEPAPIDEANEAHSRRRPERQGQSRSRNQVHAFRSAAGHDRSGRWLHQLFLQSRTRHHRARSGPFRPLRRHDPPHAARRRSSRRNSSISRRPNPDSIP